jgi:hypothetical protein
MMTQEDAIAIVVRVGTAIDALHSALDISEKDIDDDPLFLFDLLSLSLMAAMSARNAAGEHAGIDSPPKFKRPPRE